MSMYKHELDRAERKLEEYYRCIKELEGEAATGRRYKATNERLTAELDETRKALDLAYPLVLAWKLHWQHSPDYGGGKASPIHEEIIAAIDAARKANQ